LAIACLLAWFFYVSRKRKIAENERLQAKNEEILQQKEEIAAQREMLWTINRELGLKNASLTASMTYASRLQKSVLPAVGAIKQYFPEHFILFQPRDIVSGDFYWFAQTNERCMLVMGDCTGHGIPGALMSMIAYSALNKAFFEKHAHSPDELLKVTSQEIVQVLDQHHSKLSDGMDAVAMAYLPCDNRLMFAIANNSVFYIKNDQLVEVKGDKYPVGDYVYEEQRNYTLHELPVEQPISVYMSSDGYYDQFGGEHNRKITKRKFKELLLETHQTSMDYQKEHLEKFFKQWMQKGGENQTDDVLVIGLKIKPI
jgi:serine phosphatase RsbU (regulator of sigma subunit)